MGGAAVVVAEEALVVVAVEIEEEAEVVEASTEEETAATEAEARAALEEATPDLGTGPVPSQSVATPTLPGEMSATSARILKKNAWEVAAAAAAVVDMATGGTEEAVEDTGEAATETTEASEETEEEGKIEILRSRCLVRLGHFKTRINRTQSKI